MSLYTNPFLSAPLIKILHSMRDLIFLDAFNAREPSAFTSEDHETYRLLAHEVEHDLLDYPYRTFQAKSADPDDLDIHPIEALARCVCVCHMNYTVIVSPPPTGLGVALTYHAKKALTEVRQSILAQLPLNCFDLLAWALFIGAHGSLGQPERPWFLRRLADIAQLRKWRSFEEVEDVMRGYIYAPHLYKISWEKIWDEAMALLVIADVDELTVL